MGIHTYYYQIKYSDVDKNNLLSMKSLVSILQETAGMHSAEAGYSVNDREKTHVAWLVLDWKVQVFRYPCSYENLCVHTWPRNFDKLYSYRDFEVYDENNSLIAIASSKWILVDTQTKKIKKITQELIDAYGGTVEKNVFKSPWTEKIKEPTISQLNFEYTIQRRDIDTNGHVNNLHYIDYALETLNENLYNTLFFQNLEIIYKKEIRYGETIHCYYSFENQKHVITIKNKNNDTIHAIVKLF